MQAPGIEEIKAIVREMLHEQLPKGWAYSFKLSHESNHVLEADLVPWDYEWHIWRPEDVGVDLQYYRLTLMGRTGNRFVLTYGYSSAGADGAFRPEHAFVFHRWGASVVFKRIVAEPRTYPPNLYGLT